MQLTTHFTLEELIASQEATRRNINNYPRPGYIANLERLAGVLEQVRDLAKAPIIVSSGYRSPALNKVVGGAPSSAHLQGLAADINGFNMHPRDLALAILEAQIPFDQLIYEGSWVHLGISTGKWRNEVLTARFVAKRAKYFQGIV